ncbi:MAG: type II toxin-antitoxin system VapC family toxin [Solirubrobacteraceae bacterium]|nr:type II toxin-antitoxin system VapC family toxin [Solirubrobacteraceae bacterium]
MVLDSSACLDLVMNTSPGRALHDALVAPEPALLAPGLLWIEVGRVLRAKVSSGSLTTRRAEEALADFLDLGVHEVPVEPLLIRSWQLRENITIDDGVFVALAEAADRPLLTTDLRLARTVRDYADIHVMTHHDV